MPSKSMPNLVDKSSQGLNREHRQLRKAGSRTGGPPQGREQKLIIIAKFLSVKAYMYAMFYELNRLYVETHMHTTRTHTITFFKGHDCEEE